MLRQQNIQLILSKDYFAKSICSYMSSFTFMLLDISEAKVAGFVLTWQ